MGASSSHGPNSHGANKHGTLVVQLENWSCYCGQEISGLVHILVPAPLDPCTLFLRFKGKEKTSWSETRTETSTDSDGNSRTETITDYYSGKQKIVDFSRPIYSWNDGLMPGSYSLPFNFVLPTNIPGSFYYHSASQVDIIYKFQGIVVSSTHKKIKGKTPIFIKQYIQNFNTNIEKSRTVRMKSCCCIDKGICSLNVTYPQDTYSPSQIANFYVEVNNSDSKLNVVSITSRLMCSISIRDNFNRRSFIGFEVLRETINVRISPGEALLNNSGVAISLNLPSVKMDLNNMCTTYGRLIECIYTNEIRANVDGTCLSSNNLPSIRSTMYIVPNEISRPPMPVEPEGWNPVVLERVSLNFVDKPEARSDLPENYK